MFFSSFPTLSVRVGFFVRLFCFGCFLSCSFALSVLFGHFVCVGFVLLSLFSCSCLPLFVRAGVSVCVCVCALGGAGVW